MDIVFPNSHKRFHYSDIIEYRVIVDGKEGFSYISLEEFISRIGPATPATFKIEFRRLRPKLEALAREEIERKAKRDQERLRARMMRQ